MPTRPNVPADAPTVSAIIIFLNGEKFIAEAIDSVVNQTFEDWELILVNDGSTDGAPAIAQSYVDKYPGKVRLIEHPNGENRGMSASRNAGIRAARGKYVAFLDADDYWLPRRLEAHVGLLEKHPEASIVMGPVVFWRSWSRAKPGEPPSAQRWEMVSELGLPPDVVLAPPIIAIGFLEAHGGNVPATSALTAKREDVLAVGGFEEEFRSLYEDQVFYFKMCLTHKAVASNEPLAFYRQHKDSACSKEGRISGDRRMRPVFLAWLQDYMIGIGIKNPRLWKALRAEMLPFDRPDLDRFFSLPRRAIDAFNLASRRAVIFVLTPKVYNALRRKFRLKVVDVEQYM